MSTSNIYLIDKEYKGVVAEEYSNSWWFSPIIWDVLIDKYMGDQLNQFGHKKSIIGFDGGKVQKELNDIINNCDNFYDRICWELSMQQVFFSKDKDIVAKGIMEFLHYNDEYDLLDTGKSSLTLSHIRERFTNISYEILNINEEEYPHFVFKNTSVDDGVEYWFYRYDEQLEDNVDVSLDEWERNICEFVVIDNGKMEFIRNTEFFEKDL
jgi:hypothetical protein